MNNEWWFALHRRVTSKDEGQHIWDGIAYTRKCLVASWVDIFHVMTWPYIFNTFFIFRKPGVQFTITILKSRDPWSDCSLLLSSSIEKYLHPCLFDIDIVVQQTSACIVNCLLSFYNVFSTPKVIQNNITVQYSHMGRLVLFSIRPCHIVIYLYSTRKYIYILM
jgi:hypothetical protein